MVVFLAQVTQPHMTQPLRSIFHQSHAAGIVGQMAVVALYAHLEVGWIIAMQQHLSVVVGLYHEVVGAVDAPAYVLGDTAAIGNNGENNALMLYFVAHAVYAVVRNGKGCHLEIAYLQGHFFLDLLLEGNGNLLAHAPVAVDSLVNVSRRPHRHLIFATQRAHRLDVVGMVVGDQDVSHLRKRKAVVCKVFLHCTYSDAAVDHQTVAVSIKKIAVSATSTSKRNKFQTHIWLIVIFGENKKFGKITENNRQHQTFCNNFEYLEAN